MFNDCENHNFLQKTNLIVLPYCDEVFTLFCNLFVKSWKFRIGCWDVVSKIHCIVHRIQQPTQKLQIWIFSWMFYQLVLLFVIFHNFWAKIFSYLTAVRSVHCFAIFVIHCVTSLIRLCLLLVCIVVSRIFLIGARFFHGHSALDHGFIFGVLNCLQFILTQISCLI